MTFDEFAAEVQERLRADMQSVRNPQGDVHPCIFYTTESGSILRKRVPKAAFSSYEAKGTMAMILGEVARMMKPEFMAFQTTVYMASFEYDALSPEDQERWNSGLRPSTYESPSLSPDRVEKVMLIVYDSEQTKAWESTITRDDRNPPSFAEWALGGTELGGLVVDPIQRAMRARA